MSAHVSFTNLWMQCPDDLQFTILDRASPSDLAALARVSKSFNEAVQRYCERYFIQYPAAKQLPMRMGPIFCPGMNPSSMANKICILTKYYLANYPYSTCRQIVLSTVCSVAQAEEEQYETSITPVSMLVNNLEIPREPTLARRWWNETFPTICNRPEIQNLIPTIWQRVLIYGQTEIAQHLIRHRLIEITNQSIRDIEFRPTPLKQFETLAFAALTTLPTINHFLPELLRTASFIGSLPVVRAILTTHRVHEIAPHDLGKALYKASSLGHIKIVNEIIKSNRFKEIQSSSYDWRCIGHSLCSIWKSFISSGRLARIPFNKVFTIERAIKKAARHNNTNVMRALIYSGACETQSLGAALAITAETGNEEMFNALVDHPRFAKISAGISAFNFLARAIHFLARAVLSLISFILFHPRERVPDNTLPLAIYTAIRCNHFSMAHRLIGRPEFLKIPLFGFHSFSRILSITHDQELLQKLMQSDYLTQFTEPTRFGYSDYFLFILGVVGNGMTEIINEAVQSKHFDKIPTNGIFSLNTLIQSSHPRVTEILNRVLEERNA